VVRKYLLITFSALLILVACGPNEELEEEISDKDRQIDKQQKEVDTLEREVRRLKIEIESLEDPEEEEQEDEADEAEIEDEEVSASEEEDDDDSQENIDDIESDVNNIVDEDLDNTSITELRINEDASTDEERYIVLVDLEWDFKNKPNTTKDMLDMYSDHLAAKMADNDLIYELVLFWEVPYHKEDDTILKRTYENKDGGMHLTDEFKDISIFE